MNRHFVMKTAVIVEIEPVTAVVARRCAGCFVGYDSEGDMMHRDDCPHASERKVKAQEAFDFGGKS